MSTTALPRTPLRTLRVTVIAAAVGLAAVACAPAGTMAASAPTTAVAAATTTTSPATAPVVTAPTTMAAPIIAAGTATPAGGAPTDGAPITTLAPVAAAPSTAPITAPATAAAAAAPAVPVAPVAMAAVVPAASPAVTAPTGDGVRAQAARAVFDATNTFRQQNGVAALVWNDALQRSAHQHNLAMAAAKQMSHQLPGERSFDTRISDQGVPWLSVGENVGFNTDRTVTGALALHTMMINETAPNDDHKVNKLDPKFTELGVDVYLDPTTGKLWLTEDYAQI